jgi:baculoviral IAP repeat-containing protein 6
LIICFSPNTGTGTTSWNAEQALAKQKYKEQHITTILELLSCYINPEDDENIDPGNYELPPTFVEIFKKTCLIPVLCSYLRNNSGIDSHIFVHLLLYISGSQTLSTATHLTMYVV